jgi:peptidyl-tRNA hydrolase, PTH1 family
MKRFVFGLGNPGKEYQQTRHNIGFVVIDELTKKLTSQDFDQISTNNGKFYASYYKANDIFLVKPQTFMNVSGKAVTTIIDYFDKELLKRLQAGETVGSLEKPVVVCVYDDLDIPLGQWKMQFGRGPKVHNGLQSIRQYLKSDLFLHVRVGVDGREGVRNQAGSDYVLSQFWGEENTTIEQVVEEICQDLVKRLQ